MNARRQPRRNIFNINVLLVSIGVFATLIAISFFTISLAKKQAEQIMRSRINQNAINVAAHLQSEINSNIYLVNGLIAYITAYPKDFDKRIKVAMKSLYHYTPYLINIGAAPGNRISHIFPTKGNEAVIGLYYPDIPEQWNAVRKAIANKATILAGPVDLKQGGTGFISRTPVFLENGDYWGIISLVMNADVLFDEIEHSFPKESVRIAIRGKDGKGAKGEPILGDQSIFQMDSVTVTINIPGGTWQLAVIPTAGWHPAQTLLILIETFAVLACGLLAVGAYYLQQQRIYTIESEERLRTFLETTRDGVIVIGNNGEIIEFNPAAETLFQYTAEDITRKHISCIMPVGHAKHENWYAEDAKSRKTFKGRQISGLCKDGSRIPLEVTMGAAVVKGKLHYIGVIRDITERLNFEEKLRDLANTDSLTGIMNRRAFLDGATRIFKLSERNKDTFTVLMIDADHFKKVNDTYGHQVGDIVLVSLVETIKNCLRETDILGRFGGEEFIAVLPQTSVDSASEVINRILTTVRDTPIPIGEDHSLSITISMGATERSEKDTNIDDPIQRADEALYGAKGTGRDRAAVIKPT